jgi:hypothetical protein
MEIGSILIILAITVLVIAYLLKPILEGETGPSNSPSQELSTLKAQRDQILESIRDWDMSFQMGKVGEKEYRPYRQTLAQQGASVLRAIDELIKSVGLAVEASPAGAAQATGSSTLDSILEAEIQAMRESLPGSSVERVGFCTQCGAAIIEGDSFCTACGADLAA